MNRTQSLRFWLLLLSALFILAPCAHASHLRAGEITVERVGCSGLTYRITVTVFTNTINTDVLFGGLEDWLDLGDGTRVLVPEQRNVLRPDLGPGIATASYTYTHTYAGNGPYVISYSEPNRNGGVVNMYDSYNTRFYIESRIVADPILSCNSSPKLRVPPIDGGCTGVAWLHNPGAYDLDGDSLSYELVIPYRDRNTVVRNYRDPAAQAFYTNFATGNENGNGPPSFAINPITGTLTWDSPGTVGEYNIAFIVREWRKINGVPVPIGFVRRDMQIIVQDCDNERPDLDVPADVCVVAGTTLEESIFGRDVDGDNVMIQAFSEILSLAPAQFPATVSPFPAEFRPQPAELQFRWTTDCSHVKAQPYQVVFKVTDDSPSGSRLVTFKTWNITVVAPEPEWVSATPDLTTRAAILQWDSYTCDNAQDIQIWRRVGDFPFEPDSCQTGMPEGLGYQLIDIVPASTVSYTDHGGEEGLASGARYCYRLVAVFPQPRGGESYVSDEICLDPLTADRAIITNVTIDRTNAPGKNDGTITVRWRPPFEADPGSFPLPYQYRVMRAEGFAGDANASLVTTTSDTAFTDTGLNTFEKVYNYQIIAVDNDGKALDPSARASSVRLEADSELNSIRLSWSAVVPWSNTIHATPNRHLIYRGLEGDAEHNLVLLDSVDVVSGSFVYLDRTVVPDQLYCYKVMTRGGYGNPRIDEPLLNFSQRVCAQPGDSLPPCKPPTPIADQPTDCATYVLDTENCDRNVFSNILRWARASGDCDDDVSYYRIWVASSTTGTYAPLPLEIRDTVYVDANLGSRARCYRVQAVDRSGNESELSDPVCFDNCPYFELPNFFSPNGDNCNDLFSAYSATNRSANNGETPSGISAPCLGALPPDVSARCARFVQKVFVRIYNRWGKEVYNYESGGESTIYVDWDGRDLGGRELASGVYFYVADVTFDTVDPATRTRVVKGWVQLMR